MLSVSVVVILPGEFRRATGQLFLVSLYGNISYDVLCRVISQTGAIKPSKRVKETLHHGHRELLIILQTGGVWRVVDFATKRAAVTRSSKSRICCRWFRPLLLSIRRNSILPHVYQQLRRSTRYLYDRIF